MYPQYQKSRHYEKYSIRYGSCKYQGCIEFKLISTHRTNSVYLKRKPRDHAKEKVKQKNRKLSRQDIKVIETYFMNNTLPIMCIYKNLKEKYPNLSLTNFMHACMQCLSRWLKWRQFYWYIQVINFYYSLYRIDLYSSEYRANCTTYPVHILFHIIYKSHSRLLGF